MPHFYFERPMMLKASVLGSKAPLCVNIINKQIIIKMELFPELNRNQHPRSNEGINRRKDLV
jgi:hypothetical protein